MKKSFAFIIVLILQFQQLNGQVSNIKFDHIKMDKGMVPLVTTVFQDRKGYLWFGSYFGVYRYDGYTFKHYRHGEADTTSIANSNIEAICDDIEGNIWIGHTQGLDKFDPATEVFTHYTLNPELPLNDRSNHVLSLLEDRSKNLWIGTGNGLYLFNKNLGYFKRITHDSTDSSSIINNSINTIYEDRSGTVWFGTGGGLDKLEASGKFIHYWTDPQPSSSQNISPHWILCIFEDREGIMWLGTSGGGFLQLNRKTNSFTVFKNDPKDPKSLAYNYVASICEDLNGNLLISSVGLHVFNKMTKKFTYYKYDEHDSSSISAGNISKILLDRSGVIWMTTMGGGVNKYIAQKSYITQYIPESGITGKLPTSNFGDIIAEDNNQIVWIASDKGLISFDPKKELFNRYPFNLAVSYLLADKSGTLWISNWNSGSLFFKKNYDKKINRFFYRDGKAFHELVNNMCNSSDGTIWLGTSDGKIMRVNPDKKEVEQIAKYDNEISKIYEDNTGLLWIGTHETGVICYNPEQKTFERFSSNPTDSTTISGNHIMDICEDGTGALWVVANTSLNKFDRSRRDFIRMSQRDGFPSDAYSLITDSLGNLWVSTAPAGEVKYNPVTKRLKIFADIKLNTGFRMKNGELYFILTDFYKEKKSILRVNPDSLTENRFIPSIVITSFKKFEKPYPFDKSIELNNTENFLSFEFAALNFVSPEKNQYAYRLEGIDKDWVYSDTRRYASYPNLEPGEYVFRVKGSNNDGVWNEEGTSIAIIISPPFWKTWWAYTFYSLTLVFLLYGLRRYELNRLSFKNQVKIDEVVLKEKEETDKMKSMFFANISHEFRTPLTLILGPAEKISSKTSDDVVKDANIIKRNSRRLLQLINQLLDLSRLEAGKLKLEASKGNIVSFVKGVALSFESLAESKDITLKLLPEKDFIEAYFDREKMMKILTNLLSNAFKFTPQEGKITVSINIKSSSFPPMAKEELKGGSIGIKIRDTGIGIPQEEIPKLFDRFYQVDSSHTREYEGTGIGLALTKELIELHHGSIRVESEKGVWTEFSLEFQLGRDHLKDEEIVDKDKINDSKVPIDIQLTSQKTLQQINKDELIPNEKKGLKEEKKIILVVEDNYDMREYIKESLDSDYIIEEAVNGEQGVRKAEKIIPDLIVSDMMMPKMDGNELVRILKNDEKTSHIPIILLTAKAGHEDKLVGLEIGADDYLTKPFDIKELHARIKNLIKIRRRLQAKYGTLEYVFNYGTKKVTGSDDQFMIKVMDVINKHISEEDFSIEEFGNEVGMSRTQFHRKFKAVTGNPASIFLRSVRLTRAKKMLEERQGNISEIAYSVGFSSPSYFTKCFHEQFGYPPSNLSG